MRLDAFEGPMDLLLYLIRKAEVEITDIPIAEITDQYLRHLERIEEVDIDLAAEFLVMAATLMEIKSRVLAPPAEVDDDPDAADAAAEADAFDAADPRAELVQQLLEYKRLREAADNLERLREDWMQRHEAAEAGVDREALADALPKPDEVDLEDVGLYDLVEAFARIVAAVDFNRLGDHRVEIESDDTPLEIHAEDIVDQLGREAGHAIEFRRVFEGRPRVQMIGLFLATLELTRQRRIEVVQETRDAEILLRLRTPDDEGGEASAQPPADETEA